jgi:hypothetical protein
LQNFRLPKEFNPSSDPLGCIFLSILAPQDLQYFCGVGFIFIAI